MNNSLLNYFWNALIFLSLPCTPVVVAQSPSDFVYGGSPTITITGYVGSGGSVVIPSSLPNKSNPDEYLPVTAIASYAFRGISTISSITISTSVATIGGNVFED